MTRLLTRTYASILIGYALILVLVLGTVFALNPLTNGSMNAKGLDRAMARVVAPGQPPVAMRVQRANMMLGPMMALLPMDLLDFDDAERAALRRGELVRRDGWLSTMFYRQVPNSDQVLEAELALPARNDVLAGLVGASTYFESGGLPNRWQVPDPDPLVAARTAWRPVVESVDPLGLRLRVVFQRPMDGKTFATPPHWSGRAVALYLMPLIAVALSAAVVLWAMRPLRRQVQRLSDAVGELGQGRLDHRVAGQDHTGLTGRINAMAGQLERLMGEREALLQSVSHELRAPLARMSFQLERARAVAGEDAADALAALGSSQAEMTDLVEELLSYARLSDGAPDIEREEVDLAELLEDLQARLPLLEVEVPDGEVLVDGDSRLIFRALDNLGRNAERYAGGAFVQLTTTEDGVQVAFDDAGPGIPEDDRPRIFEPFYRADPSRSRQSGGAGLGLAIVARIAEKHGGSCVFAESDRGGARFVFTLPRRVG